MLRAEGCDHGQGFLFAHPLDAVTLQSYLSEMTGRRPSAVA